MTSDLRHPSPSPRAIFSLARAGIITASIGLVVNTLLMFLKLAMFIGLIALAIAAITNGIQGK